MHIVVNPFLTVSAACSCRARTTQGGDQRAEVIDVTVHVDPEVGEDELSQENLRLVYGRIGVASDSKASIRMGCPRARSELRRSYEERF